MKKNVTKYIIESVQISKSNYVGNYELLKHKITKAFVSPLIHILYTYHKIYKDIIMQK